MQSGSSVLISLFGRTGRATLQVKDNLVQMWAMLVNLTRVALSLDWLNDATLLVLLRQIYFTGVQPLGLAVFIALVSGSALVNLIITALTSIDAKSMIGPVIVFLFFKELAPLMGTTLIFIRSGPAIVSEIALMKINNEIQALRFMGVDPWTYLLLPRMVAVVVANFILSVTIAFMAMVGGFLVLGFVHYMRFSDYMLLLVREVGIDDFVVFVLKTLVFGLLIGGATMYRALGVQKAFTSVPVALIKALVSLLLYIMVVEGVFALITTAL